MTQSRSTAARSARFNAARRRDLGLGFVPEERLGRGAVPEMSLADNVLLSHQGPATVRHGHGALRRDQCAGRVHHRAASASRPAGREAAARSLSGGNLQKFIVGREMLRQPKVLVIAQPTWGVDVGAAAQIRGELVALRDAGCAVLVISEELDELFEISDRIMVIAKGRMRAPVPAHGASREQIGLWMSGIDHAGAAGEAQHAEA